MNEDLIDLYDTLFVHCQHVCQLELATSSYAWK